MIDPNDLKELEEYDPNVPHKVDDCWLYIFHLERAEIYCCHGAAIRQLVESPEGMKMNASEFEFYENDDINKFGERVPISYKPGEPLYGRHIWFPGTDDAVAIAGFRLSLEEQIAYNNEQNRKMEVLLKNLDTMPVRKQEPIFKVV